ncbi:class I SAM-dependent methyltransferase [Candidatus Magnetaquicoccus inordinatus]|uniref:class I SAM-dependent methyltransferase n=1 Tax=Candidatus Magnetaquicoccus inordinatus TaxID=2496818 RepID=UPI00102CEEFD|nr:class I SAM-dependent methyltransferase [Candidatus Magnetaquicoccus inordinatus]
MSLWSTFLAHTDVHRPVHKWKHYLPIYERYFRDFVHKPLLFMEIGCWKGGSLQMWKRYFGPQALIIGIDINPACKAFEEDQIQVRIGPQQDTQFLQSVLDEFGIPDIILDDGSHVMSHVNATFDFLYPRMAKNGIYMVEDLHTAYWQEFEGGVRRAHTFIEKAKGLIDELNADHTRGALPPTPFTRSTMAIHFYDSIAVFERCAPQAKIDLVIPAVNRVLDDVIDQLLRLEEQGEVNQMVSLVQFEADPVMLMQAIERLLQQGSYRPAYVTALVLYKNGRQFWIIAFALAVGAVLFNVADIRAQGISLLLRLSDELAQIKQEEWLRSVIAPVMIALLQGAMQRNDTRQINDFLAIVQASAPSLRVWLAEAIRAAAAEPATATELLLRQVLQRLSVYSIQ